MKKTIFFIVLIFFAFTTINAQNYKKAFKSLEKGELEAAKVEFDEAIKMNKNDAVANLGLAIVFSNSAYRGYNFFDAYQCIVVAQNNFHKIDEKQVNKISSYVSKEIVDKEIIRIDDQLFDFVKTQNKFSSVEKFVNECKSSKHYQEVVTIRNKLEFDKAKTYNTISVYKNFISKYPDAEEVPEVKELISKIAFNDAKKVNTIEAYDNFINKYPNSSKVPNAKFYKLKLDYEMTKTINSIDSYNEFIKNYPDVKQTQEIKMLRNKTAFENTVRINTVYSYTKFIKEYPEVEQAMQAAINRDSLAFIKAKSINTLEAYNDFIQNYPNAKQIKEVEKIQQRFGIGKEKLCATRERKKIMNNKIKNCKGYIYEPEKPENKYLVSEKKYDTNGNLIETIENINKINLKFLFIYDKENNLIEEKKYKADILQYKINYKYDGKWNKIKEIKNCSSSEIYNCKSSISIFDYNKNGDLTRCFCSKASGDTIQNNKYNYNDNGYLTTEIIYKRNEILEFLVSKVEYKYDVSGNLIEKIEYNSDKKIDKVDSYKRDRNGKVIEYNGYSAYGEKRLTYKYNNAGFIIEESSWNVKTNELIGLTKYFYAFY